MVSREYSCLFARNSDKKNKTWRDGVISVHATHRFARVSLYEINGHNSAVDSAIDAFDLFNRDYDNLTGETITSPRFIIKVLGVNTDFKKTTDDRIPPALESVRSFLPAKRISRTPALGTCRAFKKYCATQDTTPNSLQALPGALRGCGNGSNELHSLANTGRCTEITTITDRNTYRATNKSTMGVAFSHPSSESMRESVSPYSSKKIVDTISLSLHDAETRNPPSPVISPNSTSMLTRTFAVNRSTQVPVTLPTISVMDAKCAIGPVDGTEKQFCEAGSGFKNTSPTQRCCDLKENAPPQEPAVVSLGNEMMVNLLQTADDILYAHKSFDEAPIVDAELIGCIESALDHLGNLQAGL
ncbi:hypothetical protein, conserved [Babesia ovata]|uniref:5'-3' DNA helicase ZGRF1-like N-terminal domain-containing protein n=1 Tax=Babesia ovata TaxID=189622 RepID=A0A2H6KEM1_9APIC|nr:uncharacterized protein BOVATA_029280 [Babesia ovata]GBE61435.1 hypothetical protein, conserved [Babesia ovata]